MGWFKKRGNKKQDSEEDNLEQLPDLPSSGLPEIPSFEDFNPEVKSKFTKPFPKETKELTPSMQVNPPNPPILPSLPQSSIKQDFNSFEPDFSEQKVFPPPNPRLPKPARIIKPDERRTFEISDWKTPIERKTKKSRALFIKIDQFDQAVQSFEQIKEKLSEIESSLSKIKQIKSKEDEELKEWERELQMIKARIDSIDSSIFNKIEE